MLVYRPIMNDEICSTLKNVTCVMWQWWDFFCLLLKDDFFFEWQTHKDTTHWYNTHTPHQQKPTDVECWTNKLRKKRWCLNWLENLWANVNIRRYVVMVVVTSLPNPSSSFALKKTEFLFPLHLRKKNKCENSNYVPLQ